MAKKGVYIWQPTRIGTPDYVADELERAGIEVAALKGHDGTYLYQIQEYVDAIRARGIEVGLWGYVYLKWNPLGEALKAVQACNLYQPSFYLIDAELEAKYQFVGAAVFAKALRAGLRDMRIGMNSFWKPSYHPELPWKQLRSVCDFDCPQVYRYGMPSDKKLAMSKAEYRKLSPRLPMSMVAGDMAFEHNWKPTPQLLQEFIDAVNADPEFEVYLMWSMDQKNVVPELWAQLAGYTPTPPLDEYPIYSAVVNARAGLNVRNKPDLSGKKLYALPVGTIVYVWEVQNGWAAIEQDRNEWVYATYLTRL
jgi:hypothetical protein